MLVTTLNGAAESHPTIQESDANQKHQQVKHYKKSASDLPSLKTGDVVHIQLMPNVRKWVPGTILEVISTRCYKMKTVIGGVYVRN